MIWGRNLPLVDYLASIPDKLSAGGGLSAGNAPNDQEGHEGHEREAGEGQGEGEVLYWYDPMYPGTRFDKPGKSPFMDMDLVPRYKESSSAAGLVAIDPVTVQNLGLKTAPVKKGRLSITREVAANVEFNRYQEARVQPRAEGFVSQAGALAPGDKIEQGDLIASVTVPAWASDQSEYLLLKSQRADAKLIAGVREKLRLSGMPEDMLSEVDSSGRVQTTYRLLAPVSGVVTELDVYPGMNVDKNMTLAVIQGIDPIWVTAEVPQRDLSLAEGGRIRVTTAAWPERVFEPSSQTLLPRANSQTRTVQLRLTVPNPEGLLRPGLTASVRLRKQSGEALLIPTLSLIDLGDEKRVVTRLPGGAFAPKLVRTGSSSRGETEVLEGLSEGDEVVVSGLFLIDSEANLAGALERLRSPEPAKAADGGASPSSEAAAPMSGEAPKAQEAQEAAPPADSGRAHAHGSG
jgi:Cu(I)/Ag(I) efflux system membrane fusion protein